MNTAVPRGDRTGTSCGGEAFSPSGGSLRGSLDWWSFVFGWDRGNEEVGLMTAHKATAVCSARITLTSRAVA